ncbi:hypothetical protein NC652_007048 [Populus alba x Populus x berolinensis]|nr:hypothetical protein NC652_007048 [Populus alba x Populus x berolinensis]
MIFCKRKRKELNDKTSHTMREHRTETRFAIGQHDYLIESSESEDDKDFHSWKIFDSCFGLDLKH